MAGVTSTPELRQLADTNDSTLPAAYRNFVNYALDRARILALDRALDLNRGLDDGLVNALSNALATDLRFNSGLASALALANALDFDLEIDRDHDLASVHVSALSLDLASALALTTEIARSRARVRARSRASDVALELDGLVERSGSGSDDAPVNYDGVPTDLVVWDMTATVIYVLLGVPYDLSEKVPELTYRDSLGDSFEDAGPIRGDVERLVGDLHRAAHDPATPDDLSMLLTSHAKDGHRLFFGSDDEPRETPPRPASVYGWTVDATDLLKRTSVLPPASEAFVEEIVENPTPEGLRDGLNSAIDNADFDEPDVDDPDWEYEDPFFERFADAFNELVNDPSNTATVIAYRFLFEGLGVGGPSGWLLSVLLVLLQLVRRQSDS